jgi:hypothetical protein
MPGQAQRTSLGSLIAEARPGEMMTSIVGGGAVTRRVFECQKDQISQ